MFEIKDYSEKKGDFSDSHYNGVPSMYGKICAEQVKMQPRYCEPGEPGDGMVGEHRNTQAGP